MACRYRPCSVVLVASALLAWTPARAEDPAAAAPGPPTPAGDIDATDDEASDAPLAQPNAAWQAGVPAAERAHAQRLFGEANARFGDKEYPQALELYRQARAAWNHPSINYNMAVCLLELGQDVAAWEALTQALRFGQGPLSDHNYANAQRYQKLLEKSLAFVRVRVAEVQARVTLDGQALLVGPGEVSRVLMPGSHQLVASKEGFLTRTQSTVVPAGVETLIELVLEPVTEVVSVRRWPTAVPWAVVGGGVLLAVGGVPLILGAANSYAEYDDYIDANCAAGCAPSALPGRVRDAKARGDAERGGAIAIFVLGGAAVVVGAVLVVMNQPKEERRPVATVTPQRFGVMPLPGGGVAVTGAFGF